MASVTQWAWFEQIPGDGEGQGCLLCCSPWGAESQRRPTDRTTTRIVKCSVTFTERDLRLGHQKAREADFYKASASRCFRVTGCMVSATPIKATFAGRRCP